MNWQAGKSLPAPHRLGLQRQLCIPLCRHGIAGPGAVPASHLVHVSRMLVLLIQRARLRDSSQIHILVIIFVDGIMHPDVTSGL